MVTLQQKLEDAQKAYHLLNTGKMARVVVDQNGERVEFTATNRTALYNYIQQLEQQVNASRTINNKPARFLF